MKFAYMKFSIIALVFALIMSPVFAQSSTAMPSPLHPVPVPVTSKQDNTFVTGTLDIDYQSVQNPDKAGLVDTYTYDLNVSNSTEFVGTIKQLPYKPKNWGMGGQNGFLDYNLKLFVINPHNVSQKLSVGMLAGRVPVSDKNVYDFEHGTLTATVLQRGNARGFDSATKGEALGKPPTPAPGILDHMTKEALSFTKIIGTTGQVQKITVTKYDIMEFHNHILSAGPAQTYTEATVNGQMVYSYDPARQAWYFNHLIVTFWITDPDGSSHQVQDTLSGDIRWNPGDTYAKDGIGQYDFDIRVNEPPPAPDAQFVVPSGDDAFFTNETAAKGLQGTMKYHDTMQTPGDAGLAVTSSHVEIDLHGTQISKQEAMYLCKLIMFSDVVPMSAD